jgi:hypothetical protein
MEWMGFYSSHELTFFNVAAVFREVNLLQMLVIVSNDLSSTKIPNRTLKKGKIS